VPRRDQLTYDLSQGRRAPVPRKPALLLAAVAAVGALLLGWTVLSSRTPGAPPVSAAATASTSPSPSAGPPADPATGRSPATRSPEPAGSDAEEGPGAPEGSEQAASVFVRAWLDPHAETRRPALGQVATPALAEQLMLTDPANVPRARPRGTPVLTEAATYSAQFTQTLSSGRRIKVYLVADPGARYRWLATSVDQA